MKRSLIVFGLAALLLVPAGLLGQARTTGGVHGKIVDEAGAPIADATISVTSTDFGLEWEATTTASGEFRLTGLPVGDYSVAVTALGYQPTVLTFRLDVGVDVPLSVQLAAGEAVAQEITVFSAPTALETTAVGGSLDYGKEVEELPINNRDINTIAFFAPNMAFNPNNNPSISGAPGTDTVVMLDGAEVSDPYFGSAPTLFLEDAVEEVQVLTSGVSARYGRFQGGVINAVTKAGSNQYEVTLRTEWEKESWNSRTPFGEEQSEDLEKVRQLTAGGFLMKDHLWWFGGIRDVPDSSTANTTNFDGETYNTVRSEDRWQAKLRGAPSADHIFDISHLEYEAETSNRAGLPPGDIKFTNGVRADPRETNTFAYQGVLSPRMFLDVQATEKKVSIQSGGDPAGSDPIFTNVPFAFWNNHWWDFSDPSVRDNETASASLSYSMETAKTTHFFEGGVQYVNSTTGGENRQSATGKNLLLFGPGATAGFDAQNNALFNIGPGTDTFAFRWDALALGGTNEIENTALYLQDTITLREGKLRLDVGLRYDDVTSTSPLAFQNFSFTDFSPRLALAINIDPTWQLLLTGGKYLGRLNDNIFGDATGVGSAPRIETFYTGPTFTGITGEEMNSVIRNDAYWTIVTELIDPTQPTTFLTRGVNAPHANDYSFGIRKAFARNTGNMTATYHYRKFNDLLEDFVGGVCTDHGLSFDTGGVPACDTITAFTPDPTELDVVVWGNSPDAQRDYQAFTLTWDYRPTAKLALFGNYTFSQVEGNFEGEGQNQPAAGGSLHDYVQSRSEALATPVGKLDEDITHRLKTGGIYNFDFGRPGRLALGGSFTFQSGDVWSKTATVAFEDSPLYLNDAGQTFTGFFDRRGSERFEDWWRLDLSARYQVAIWNKVNFWAKVSALNVTNEGAVRSMNTAASARLINGVLTWVPNGDCGLADAPSQDCSAFGRIRNEGDYQAPRSYLLTAGLTWR